MASPPPTSKEAKESLWRSHGGQLSLSDHWIASASPLGAGDGVGIKVHGVGVASERNGRSRRVPFYARLWFPETQKDTKVPGIDVQ